MRTLNRIGLGNLAAVRAAFSGVLGRDILAASLLTLAAAAYMAIAWQTHSAPQVARTPSTEVSENAERQ